MLSPSRFFLRLSSQLPGCSSALEGYIHNSHASVSTQMLVTYCFHLNSQYENWNIFQLIFLWKKCKSFQDVMERLLCLLISQGINEGVQQRSNRRSEQENSLIKGHFILSWRFDIHKNAAAIGHGDHNHVGRTRGKGFFSFAEQRVILGPSWWTTHTRVIMKVNTAQNITSCSMNHVSEHEFFSIGEASQKKWSITKSQNSRWRLRPRGGRIINKPNTQQQTMRFLRTLLFMMVTWCRGLQMAT